MIIGVPKEIKNNEYRVGMVPSGVRDLVSKGHKVLVERAAGEGSGISDEDYLRAGAVIKGSAKTVFNESEMIVKVKEPQPSEWELLEEEQVLFTYLHLAPALELTQALLEKGVTGIAYETVQAGNGALPLLEPMSEIAGKLSIQAGAHFLQRENGGSGTLLGGVPGIKAARVTIIGAGTVGTNAAMVALGMGARVTILDIRLERLRYLAEMLNGKIETVASSRSNIEACVAEADLVIGATLIPGARAEKLVKREMLATMKKGSVLVDVAVDQGGCCETTVPTTYEKPVFVVDGVVHYCVANMPSAVSRSATYALTNATFPYVATLADHSLQEAFHCSEPLRKGLSTYQGKLVSAPVARSLNLQFVPFEDALLSV